MASSEVEVPLLALLTGTATSDNRGCWKLPAPAAYAKILVRVMKVRRGKWILFHAFGQSWPGRKVWKKHNESLWMGRGQREHVRSSQGREAILFWSSHSVSPPNVRLHTDWVMGTAVIIWHMMIKPACGQTAHGAPERTFPQAGYLHVDGISNV